MPTVQSALSYSDESTPVHAGYLRGHPLVVFGNHGFCAGRTLDVRPMPAPHMHSQIEFNVVLEGRMHYWFDGRQLSVSAGRLAFFWGMIPHQVTEIEEPTRFVCLYAPMSVFLGLPALSELRKAIFQGAMIEALEIRPYDRDVFLRWREDLLLGDRRIEQIVRDELTLRVRRLDLEGWRDLRASAPLAESAGWREAERLLRVEIMSRFIAERGVEDISAEDVARASGLHPNYAMTLYRRCVGQSIKQSIQRHRLDAAQSMLIGADQPISQVAFNCGFGSLSSFYEAFKQRFQMSPAAFRRSLRPRP